MHIERSVGSSRLCDDVPTPIIQDVVHTNLDILRIKPRFFELWIDTWAVSTVNIVVDIGRRTILIAETIFHKVHVFACLTAHNRWVIAFYSGLCGIVNLLQGHVGILTFNLIGEHTAPVSIAVELLTHCIIDLILQGRNILTIGIYNLRITQTIVDSAIVTRRKSTALLFFIGIIKPFSGIQHQQLCIVIRHGVVGAEVVCIALVLGFNISFAEMLRAIRVAEAAIKVFTNRGNRIREDVFDVGCTTQILIMVGQNHTIFRHLQIAFQIIGSHFACPSPGSLGLFGCPESRTTVCHTSIKWHIIAHLCHLIRDFLNVYALSICVGAGKLLLVRARCQKQCSSDTGITQSIKFLHFLAI